MNNQYDIGKEIIENSDWSTKKVKTFRGHDGQGVNADIYCNGKKIAEVNDDGWGGGLAINYMVEHEGKQRPIGRKEPEEVTSFLATLPTYTNKEWYDSDDIPFEPSGRVLEKMDEAQTWGHEDLFNQLIDRALNRQEFKKVMRKVAAIQDGGVITLAYKSAELDKEFKWKALGIMTLRNMLKTSPNWKDVTILNFLPEGEAFELYLKHI